MRDLPRIGPCTTVAGHIPPGLIPLAALGPVVPPERGTKMAQRLREPGQIIGVLHTSPDGQIKAPLDRAPQEAHPGSARADPAVRRGHAPVPLLAAHKVPTGLAVHCRYRHRLPHRHDLEKTKTDGRIRGTGGARTGMTTGRIATGWMTRILGGGARRAIRIISRGPKPPCHRFSDVSLFPGRSWSKIWPSNLGSRPLS